MSIHEIAQQNNEMAASICKAMYKYNVSCSELKGF